MSIEGTWYWNPGDIPADFVHPVVLHADGRFEWADGSRRIQDYKIEADRLTVGDPAGWHMVFQITGKDVGWISGTILTPSPRDVRRRTPAEEGPLLFAAAEIPAIPVASRPDFFTDTVVLMRDPRGLDVVLDAQPAT
jgi:hypothetical protein